MGPITVLVFMASIGRVVPFFGNCPSFDLETYPGFLTPQGPQMLREASNKHFTVQGMVGNYRDHPCITMKMDYEKRKFGAVSFDEINNKSSSAHGYIKETMSSDGVFTLRLVPTTTQDDDGYIVFNLDWSNDLHIFTLDPEKITLAVCKGGILSPYLQIYLLATETAEYWKTSTEDQFRLPIKTLYNVDNMKTRKTSCQNRDIDLDKIPDLNSTVTEKPTVSPPVTSKNVTEATTTQSMKVNATTKSVSMSAPMSSAMSVSATMSSSAMSLNSVPMTSVISSNSNSVPMPTATSSSSISVMTVTVSVNSTT